MWAHCNAQLIFFIMVSVLLIGAIGSFLRMGWVWGAAPAVVRVYRSDSPFGYWFLVAFWSALTAVMLNAVWLIVARCSV